MVAFAAQGRRAMGGRVGLGRWHQRWRVVSWLVELAAALSRGDDSDATTHVTTHTPITASAAEAREASEHPATDPRAEVTTLYERHARAVLGYLCARLPTLADAEDALAEVFVAALAQCAAGKSPGPGWLLTVARRRAADFYRYRHAAESLTVVTSTALATIADSPEDNALRAETVRAALARVAALPDDQRDALALRFAAGLRTPQIATVLGKSDEATRALLSRALRRLRKELAE